MTYFVADRKKAGGKYVTASSNIKRIDDLERILHFTDGTKIPMDNILQLDGEIFARLLRNDNEQGEEE